LQKGSVLYDLHMKLNPNLAKVLVLAHEASRYSNILQSTKAIVFFGTPHSGSDQADLLFVLADIVSKFGSFGSLSMIDRGFGKVRQDLVRILKPRSIELEALSMSFTERSKELEIISFYEENAMFPFKHVVSLFSLSDHIFTLKCSVQVNQLTIW
jgi:hypothetical protein